MTRSKYLSNNQRINLFLISTPHTPSMRKNKSRAAPSLFNLEHSLTAELKELGARTLWPTLAIEACSILNRILGSANERLCFAANAVPRSLMHSAPPEKRILIVDDYAGVRETLATLLTAAGYEVSTAEDGFSALLQFKRTLPDLVLSDLNMPSMSGFELLSVIRRRFPQLLVVAMSAAYGSGDSVPGGVIADAFYAKSNSTPEALLKTIAEVFSKSVSKKNAHTKLSAPVWIPRNGMDSHGIPYVVLTCTECLRSFPINVASDAMATVEETLCIFCLNQVRYIIDFSLSIASPRKPVEGALDFKKTAAG